MSNSKTPKPKYSANVPEFVLTPDKVETEHLGELEFFDGLPNETTVEKVYSFLDLSRGVHAFLNGMPAASLYAMLEGLKDIGLEPGGVAITENLLDARSLFLTPNTTTPYITGEIDLKDGPVVLDIRVPVLGAVDDAFFRYVCDVGLTGPDQGRGGKYLFVGPDYEGDIPEGYFVFNSATYRHWFFLRLMMPGVDLQKSISMFKEGFHCYPLAQVQDPPPQQFVDFSGKQMNTIHPNNDHFYEELNAVVQYEPADAFNPELVGLFASIGIKMRRMPACRKSWRTARPSLTPQPGLFLSGRATRLFISTRIANGTHPLPVAVMNSWTMVSWFSMTAYFFTILLPGSRLPCPCRR